MWDKYKPSKKWWTALVTGVAGVVVSVIESGEFGDTEQSALKVLAVALVGAWLKRNDATPTGDGVPA
jgi:hypothetical protein